MIREVDSYFVLRMCCVCVCMCVFVCVCAYVFIYFSLYESNVLYFMSDFLFGCVLAVHLKEIKFELTLP